MIFAVDIGTTVLKAALFNKAGRPSKLIEKQLSLVGSSNPLYHETDAEEWIRAIKQITEELIPTGTGAVSAIAVSGNGPTLVPVGTDDKPLDLAMSWMDRRGVEEAEIISDLNGFYVDPTFYLPKALWFFKKKPGIYEKTKYFFSCPEYINYLLTGNAQTILPVVEYKPYIWTKELVEKLGMDWKKFPDFIRPGDFVGKTTAAATGVFGLPEGVPVFAGGADFVVSLLGTGTVAPGRACERSGTSEGINLCTDQLVKDTRLICVSHVIEGLKNISGIISTSGKALEWFKNTTGRAENPFPDIFDEILSVPAGANSLVFLPYLTGERAPIWNPDARGAFIGLTMNHGRKEMTRAVIESVGFAIRDIISVMEEIGLDVDDLRITGRPAKSELWTQIKSDITGKRILMPVMKDAELAGDMCVALYGLKRYSSLAEAAETAVQIEKVFEPNRENKKVYDGLFSVYRESYTGLKEVFKSISKISTQEK